jgi:hypothetical protein
LHAARASIPGSDRVDARRLRVPALARWGLLVAGVGVALWVLLQPRTPDLAAQVYRVDLFRQVGFSVWDERWYGGHDLPGYSLTFPPLAALLGIRGVGVLAVLASVALFERITRAFYGSVACWGAVWFALAAVGDVWVGRVTFALGVSLALGATLAFVRGRIALTVFLGALCAASSPVVGAFLALGAVSLALARRSPRVALELGGPALGVVVALAALFPEGGFEPFPTLSFLATLAVVVGFLWVLPRKRRVERVGALAYLAACLASLVIHTPMGSNVERYGVLLAGPLLLSCVLSERSRSGRPLSEELAAVRRSVPVACVLVGIAVWVLWGPVRETAAVSGNASTDAAYYRPVERFVAAHGGSTVRVEVPFTRGHWEAAWLAPSVSLARGWEKQLDERYDGVLLGHTLTAAGYHAWLRREAVTYVALPDAPLDSSSAQEGRLIRTGLPYLRPVFTGPHWQIYEVLDAVPLVSGPGRLTAMDHDAFTLAAQAAGVFVVRVHYSRYLTIAGGRGCVSRAAEGWTTVSVEAPGRVTVTARFSLGRALGIGGSSCPAKSKGISQASGSSP